ncbi:hypothetical protein [Mesoaciditoga lauensis]|uniref:hypothetical protein n=1 Tax=Mesoaciditoga lauensis TaxID=1495039 RepID=UPI00056184EA|nr:hypothetical protein [Mesoaciditoga lauensis]
MRRWKVIGIVSILALLVLTLFLSNKIVYFSDDGGSGDHSGDKNPQTTLMENVKPQEMLVELQKMAVIVTKNA